MEGEYPLRDEWQLHFASDSGYQLIHGKALSAELRHSRLRSVAWLVFLGVVEGPPTAWPVTLATLRARYAALRDKVRSSLVFLLLPLLSHRAALHRSQDAAGRRGG